MLLTTVGLLVLPTSPCEARWAEFLPSSSWIDEDLALLRAQRLLSGLPTSTHPLARADVAEALGRLLHDHPGAAQTPVVRRLAREFARELAELAPPVDLSTLPEIPHETSPLVSFGDMTAAVRVYAYAAALTRAAPDSHVTLEPGSRVGARVYVRLPSSVALYEEGTVGRIRDAKRFADLFAGINDLAEDVPRAYVSAAPGNIRFQLGRDAARWGPGRDGTLLLSDAAGPTSTLSVGGTFWRRLTAVARTSVLSSERKRYLAAHRIEWQVTQTFTLGLAEAATYVSSAPEPLYLLGIIPYTIVQRQVTTDTNADSLVGRLRNNLEVGFDAIWSPLPNWETRLEVLVDDLQLGHHTTPNRGGVQFGVTRVVALGGAGTGSVEAEYTRVSRFTYSVYYSVEGDRDFILRGAPLGFWLGPDAEDGFLRLTWDSSRAVHLQLTAQQTRTGAEPLGSAWMPGEPVRDVWRLVAPVERRRSLTAAVRLTPVDVFTLHAGVGVIGIRSRDHLLGVDSHGVVTWLGVEARK
jgi:hypothetical protein